MHSGRPGRAPLDDRLDALLVDGVGPGVEQAHRQRLDALREQPVERALDVGLVERLLHRAASVDPLAHLHPQAALDQGGRLLPGEVVQTRHAQAPDLEDVAEAPRGDQPGPGAAQLEQRVGGDGGAVQHLDHVATAEPGLVEHLAQPVDDGARVVVDAGRHLLDVQASVGVEEDDVGEGAADVDRDAEAAHAFRSISRTAANVSTRPSSSASPIGVDRHPSPVIDMSTPCSMSRRTSRTRRSVSAGVARVLR